MKILATLAVLALITNAASAGIAYITIEQSGSNTIYRFNGREQSLVQIQKFYSRANSSERKVHPKLEGPLDIIPVGDVAAEALIPLLVCLKEAGQRRCTLNLSHEHDGKHWAFQHKIDLDRVFESKTDWRRDLLRNKWPTKKREPPNQTNGR